MNSLPALTLYFGATIPLDISSSSLLGLFQPIVGTGLPGIQCSGSVARALLASVLLLLFLHEIILFESWKKQALSYINFCVSYHSEVEEIKGS